MQPASMPSRFAAMALDMLIYNVVMQLLRGALLALAPNFLGSGVLIFLSLLVSVVLYVIPTWKFGQTLGKKALALKVVSAKSESDPLGFGAVLLRETVGKFVGIMALGAGYIIAYFNPEHIAWHDSWSGTRVVSLLWDEEKTFFQRVRTFTISAAGSLISSSVLVALFLYSSLPLGIVRQKMQEAGLRVGSLTGSLGSGLHMTDVRDVQDGSHLNFKALDVKLSLSSLWSPAIVIKHLSIEEGVVGVPSDFSLQQLLPDGRPQAEASVPAKGAPVRKALLFREVYVNKLHFRSGTSDLVTINSLAMKDLRLADEGYHLGSIQVDSTGLQLLAQDVSMASEGLSVGEAKGAMTPDWLKVLKVPIDYELKGVFTQNWESSRFQGNAFHGKVQWQKGIGSTDLTVKHLSLGDYFKTSLPLEELDLRVAADSKSFYEFTHTVPSQRNLKICGNLFQNGPRSLEHHRDGALFSFQLNFSNDLDWNKTPFAKNATFDQLFNYALVGSKIPVGAFESSQEMLSDLCYHKKYQDLQGKEIDLITRFRTASRVEAPQAQKMPFGQAMVTARAYLQKGQLALAQQVLQDQGELSQAIDPENRAVFYGLRGWVSFYMQQFQDAASSFQQAFSLRQDASDAEGLMRSYQELKDKPRSEKWTSYLRNELKNNPDVKSHLSPNTVRKLASE